MPPNPANKPSPGRDPAAELAWVMGKLAAGARAGTNGAVLPLLLPGTRSRLLRMGFDYQVAGRSMWVFWRDNQWMRIY
jgi:hypothetical protein